MGFSPWGAELAREWTSKSGAPTGAPRRSGVGIEGVPASDGERGSGGTKSPGLSSIAVAVVAATSA